MKKREIVALSLFATLIFFFSQLVNAAIICNPGDFKFDTGAICLNPSSSNVIDGNFCTNVACLVPSANYCGDLGFFTVEGDHPSLSGRVLTIQTPSLPFEEIYNLTFTYRRGGLSGGLPQNQEGFKIECGGVVYDFPDDPSSTAPEIWAPHHVNCKFNSGINIVNITTQPADIHSTHFEDFRIEKCLPITTGSTEIPAKAFPFFTKFNIILTIFIISLSYFFLSKQKEYIL